MKDKQTMFMFFKIILSENEENVSTNKYNKLIFIFPTEISFRQIHHLAMVSYFVFKIIENSLSVYIYVTIITITTHVIMVTLFMNLYTKYLYI